ncbi:MAG: EamA family transporter, partial [Rhodococcus sp. (in: high G+C Gram-positive bacteria)]
GWRALAESFSATGWPALAGLAYIVLVGTIAGSGLWTVLISRNPAGVVAPFSLLVPVVGIGAAWIFLAEIPTVLSLIGAAVVIVGSVGGMASRRAAAAPAPLAEPLRV